MSLRTLQRRVAKLEKGAKPRPSPFDAEYGSFDGFADAAYAEVEAGRVAGEFLRILDALRTWDEGGVWVLAYAR